MHLCWLLCHRDEYPHQCSKWYAQFPGGEIRFFGVVHNVLCSSLVVPSCPLFPEARYAQCQKWNAAAAGFANSFSTLPQVQALEFQAFRKLLDLRSEKSDDQCSLQVSWRWSWIANDVVCQNSNPWSCAFDHRTQYTAFWSVLSVELCNHHEIILPPGLFQKDSWMLERLPDGLYLSPFLPGINPFPNMDWKFQESPLWNTYLFQLRGINTKPLNSGSIGIPPEFPWIVRK